MIEIRENAIKKALREGRVAVGSALGEFATRGIAKILEQAGLDWVMIDMLSSGYTMDTVADLVAWFKATPIAVLVRPPNSLPETLSAIMDVGAAGVVAPEIHTAAQARAIVNAVMYPPLGNRGVSMNVAHTDFTKPNLAEYLPARNAQTSVAVLIESREGLENVDEIAAVEGIDMLQPSHNDLTVALGIPDQYGHPIYKEALQKVAAACKRHGKVLKFNPHGEQIAEYHELGCRVMGVNHLVVVLREGVKGEVTAIRRRLAQASPGG